MSGSIAHTGQVRRVEAGQATIAVATSGCSSCGHAGGCGIGKLAGGRRETLITLPGMPGLGVGEHVTLELTESQITRAALLGYLMPALLLLTGAWLGNHSASAGITPDADASAALGAMLGLAAGLLLSRFSRPLMPRLSRSTD